MGWNPCEALLKPEQAHDYQPSLQAQTPAPSPEEEQQQMVAEVDTSSQHPEADVPLQDASAAQPVRFNTRVDACISSQQQQEQSLPAHEEVTVEIGEYLVQES